MYLHTEVRGGHNLEIIFCFYYTPYVHNELHINLNNGLYIVYDFHSDLHNYRIAWKKYRSVV
jgi:hypothetical protein